MSTKMKPVVWNGVEMTSMNDIFQAALTVKTKEEAEEFIKAYLACGLVDREAVLSNLGYWAGYYGEKERRFVAEMFGAMHPVFGENFAPTAKQAFEAGLKIGREGLPKKGKS